MKESRPAMCRSAPFRVALPIAAAGGAKRSRRFFGLSAPGESPARVYLI